MDQKADAREERAEQAEDAELIARFRAGDESSFDSIVLRYRKDVYRLAWRLTGSHAEADDLAQETFCRAYVSLHGFRGESSLRTWLCRIVTNLGLNLVQSARVARRQEISVEALAEAGEPATVQAPVGADNLLRAQREARLRCAIAALPSRQKETLMMRVFEGMQYKEIARAMGCSTGTAKANFFHAVASLKRALKDEL